MWIYTINAGTYMATLTSSTSAGTATISGTINGTPMTNTAAVTFTPGSISAATSTITANPTSIAANGTSTSLITVQAKDSNGNNLTTGGATVGLGTNLGTLNAVTYGGNGTYTATLTSSTSAGTATISGTINTVGMTNTAAVTFTTCVFSLSSSGISAPSGGMGGSVNVLTSSACPWSAMSDSAWLTTTSTGTGNGSVSFNVAANTMVSGRSGKITVSGRVYTVTQSGVRPTSLVATTSTNSVSLTWTASAVDHFEVWRNAGAGFALLFSHPTANYTDSAVAISTAYVYKVRAVDSTAAASAYSNLEVATTIVFTDDPLVPQSTVIKAIHLTQLRQAVTAVSTLARLTPSFTDPSPNGVPIKLVHVTDLRNALDAARMTLGLSPLIYTNIMAGSPVSATDFTQLRNGVK